MLAFVTSLRHPQNSSDYSRVESLLKETLGSITNQDSDDYIVIVVGNKRPSFELPARTEFIEVGFEAPAPPDGPRTAMQPFIRDKGTKIGVGLLAARRYAPDFVMIFDADDFVHRGLTRFVGENPHAPGWVIDRGWMFSRSRNGYRVQDQFHRTCGTSYLIPYDAYDVPENLDESATQEELIEAYGEILPNILGAHRNAVQWHRERGRVLSSVPFRAAIYLVDTGENHSGKTLPGLARIWTARFGESFGVQSSRGMAQTVWRCWGPRGIGQTAVEFVQRRGRKLRNLARPEKRA